MAPALPATLRGSAQPKSSVSPTSGVAHMATTTLSVEGMTCGSCSTAVESAFNGLSGVGNVSVSLVMERAVVQHDPNQISPADIKEIIEDRGFDAEVLSTDIPHTQDEEVFMSDEDNDTPSGLLTTTLSVGGMTCGACTSAVEGAFVNVPGVKSFSISLLSERAVVEHDPSLLTADAIAETIEDTGFDAKVLDSKPADAVQKRRVRRRSSGRLKSTTTKIAIEGMTCGACTSAVESGFAGVEGVISFNISLLAERAVITHDITKLPVDKIVEIVEDRGFDARVVSSRDTETDTSASSATVQLKIYGLPDIKSTTDLESTLRLLPGVDHVNINYSTSRASITYNNATIGLRALVDAVEQAGFNALVAESDDNNAQLESLAKTKEIQEWRRAFRVSLSFAIPVFITTMILPMIPPLNYGAIPLPIPGLWLGDVVSLLLTIPVQFGIGKRFYASAFKSLRHRSPTMDVLVVLGTSAAFFFSVASMLVSVLTQPHSRPSTVFDTSTMLITFITLGRYLENGAKSQTSKALSRLMSLAPSMATIYVDPIAAEKLAEADQADSRGEKSAQPENRSGMSEEKIVPTELIQVGDIVVLRPGDKIPADGTVISGQSYVDESMVTGEAMPILKKPTSLLMAGTVNGAGRLDFKVTRAGRDTQLSQIVRLVQEAQTSRAPIQRVADVIAGYFVPVIIALGLFTFVSWMVLSHVLPHPPQIFLDHASGGRFMVCLKLCISVIVFACPCALGLSTPTAVMVGTGVGAEQGILVKGGAALETATKITHVVFDKTGTLTTGKMSVSKTDLSIPTTEDTEKWTSLWWTLVGLAEMSSEHPVGKAIIRGAKEHLNLGVDGSLDGSTDHFEAVVGRGITATVIPAISGYSRKFKIQIGNSSFLRAHGVTLPKLAPALSTNTSTDSINSQPAGTTVIHTAIDARYAGCLHLSDTIKPTAAATVKALQLMNIPSYIVTGDALPTALSVAALVSIPSSRVRASASPDEKQAFIRDLQATGAVVAMVGDGINDSPALATADIGVSMATGTDVAMEAADVVLMRAEELLDVAAALHLARTIFRRIKMNLLWACGYNVVGLPFAMGVALPWGYSLHPMAAGAAMAFSSVSVVVSSLLLKFWRRPGWMDAAYLETMDVKPVGAWRAAAREAAVWWRRLRGFGARRTGRDDVAYVQLTDMEAA